MEHLTQTDAPALLDLIESSRWQRLQDHFSDVLGVTIRTLSPTHELIVNPSWPMGVLAEQAIETLQIGDELDMLVPTDFPRQELSSIVTPLGLTYAALPVRANAEEVLAYLVLGPMIVGPLEDEASFRKRIEQMGRNPQELRPLILSLKSFTFSGIRSALNLIEEMSVSLVQFAYQSNTRAAILPPMGEIDQAIVRDHTDTVLRSLLEAATLATKADGGSIMVYDAKSDGLKIKVAQGLKDEVVSGTCVKRGEGIAGLAVQERSILLVDDQTADPRIKSRMSRGELSSSLVAPLSAAESQEPFGVLNLRISDPNRRFSMEHIELLKRLLDLTKAALGSLRSAFRAEDSAGGTN